MKSKFKVHSILNIIIAMVWMINGLFCKILNFVPRHQQIVTEILGSGNAKQITIFIGVLEVILALWILIGLFKKTHAILQITVVMLMNVIEQIRTPEMLLWGNFNLLFAIMFVTVVYFNYFILHNNQNLNYATNS